MQRSDVVRQAFALALVLPSVTVLALVGACVSVEQLRIKERDVVIERAAFDLECDAADIEATPLGDALVQTGDPKSLQDDVRQTTYGVRGCGQRAAYVVQCLPYSPAGTSCSAVLNSDAQEAQ